VIATMNDSVYAYDVRTLAKVWSVSLGSARTSYPTVGGEQLLYGGAAGCVSTPVSDLTYIYVACTNTTPTWVLYKLNITDGSTAASRVITGTVTGTGDPTGGDLVSGGVLTFYPDFEFNRSALALNSGNVYVAFGSYDDAHPWHGWLFSIDASAMTISALWCATPNGYGGAMWYAGGPAIDGSGNIYAMTGNGDYDGTANFSESFVKLNSSLVMQDWFTPSDWATLTAADKDIDAGPMLVSGLVVGGAKDSKVYSVNASCMGHLGGTVGGCTAPQTITTDASILFSTCTAAACYFSNNSNKLHGYTYSGSTFSTSAILSPSATASPGQAASSSFNGTSTGIVWMTTVASSAFTSAQAATLRALNAADLTEIWNSDTSGKDTLGSLAKYAAPVVVNGLVLVPTQSGNVAVYGSFPGGSSLSGGSSISGGASIQ
jgi:hypothetical protein